MSRPARRFADIPADVEFDAAMLAERPAQDLDVAFDAAMDNVAGVPADVEFDVAMLPAPALDPPKPVQSFDFSFGSVWAPAGATSSITISPQCVFRAEKLMATDTCGGLGTAIVQVTVGRRIQRPGNVGQGSLTQFFAQNALANGITFDTTHKWEHIAIQIQFIQACTFSAVLFGSADIESKKEKHE